MKKRGLGRGLDALLSQASLNRILKTQQPSDCVKQLTYIPIEQLQSGRYQPRKEFDMGALQELADSITAQGLLSPLIVRRITENQYEIVAGERRWRAAQLAKLHEIPVLIQNLSDQSALAIALIENIQREELSPIETALALQRLMHEFDLNHEQIAKLVGKSRSSISNLLRLLNLQTPVKEMLTQGHIEMGHARALLSLEENTQQQLAHDIVARKLSVRQTEKRVRQLQHAKKISINEPPLKNPDVAQLQQSLSDKLGVPVVLKHHHNKGQLIIHYANLDILDGIISRIH